jgi:lactate dehydrogenase-like 2-hydroxyacid dehydrogenase
LSASRPRLLAHPGLGAFEGLFGQHHQIVRLADDPALMDVRAAVVIGSIGLPREVLERAPNLQLVACFGAGTDGVDRSLCAARGIAVTNCPAINHEDVADVAIGLLISVARNVAACDRMVRAGGWSGPVTFPPARRLRGRKLGIIGLGAIGRAVADRAAALGLETRWTGPRPKPDAPWPYEPDRLSLSRWADVLAICAPGGPETDKIVDAAMIEALGRDGLLINVARGSLVDEDALIAALKDGRLGGAGLDVFETELTPPARWADVPNVTLTPHLGGATREAIMESAQLVLENLRRFFAGEPLATPLD